jgi:hypothetical protein
MRQEDLDLTLDEPFIPFTPIKAFPKNEHGDVYPTKKCRSFDYEKEAKAIYRPKTFFFQTSAVLYSSDRNRGGPFRRLFSLSPQS